MARTYVTKHCLFCKEKEDLKELYPRTFHTEDLTPEVFSARRITEHFHYRIVRCRNCGLVFSRETLSDDDLFDLYSQSSVTFEEQIPILQRDYWRPMQRFFSEISEEKSALEIGCSNGFFLEELKNRGFKKVAGFEPSREAKARAKKSVSKSIRGEFFCGRASVPNESFDLVCSFQTLDHLPDPVGFLRGCREVMRPGGLIYIVTHNVDALQAKVLGEKSPIIDVEHTYLYNKKTLPRLIESAGFRILHHGNFQNSYPLSYWVKMLPLKPPMKRIAGNLLKWSKFSSFSPALSAGNIYAVGTPI